MGITDSKANETADSLPKWLKVNHAAAFATCVALVMTLGWICRFRLNPDAVRYVTLASYYKEGQLNLALSGHWSPLISWLLIPLLGLHVDPLVACRIVVGVS